MDLIIKINYVFYIFIHNNNENEWSREKKQKKTQTFSGDRDITFLEFNGPCNENRQTNTTQKPAVLKELWIQGQQY